MIKNIIFDMGEVLIHWTPEMILDRFHLEGEDREIIKWKILKSYQWSLLDDGYYENLDDFLAEMLPKIPEHLRPVAVDVAKHWYKPTIAPVAGMAELLDELKKHGYKLYLLSNAGPNHRDYWHEVPGHGYFDGICVSAYEKLYKPSIAIFERILEKFSLVADECVFIDDLNTNCAGAFL